MKLAWLRLVSMAAAAPLAISASAPEDSAVTSLTVSGGAGSYAYVTRGCDGSVISANERTFQDAGVTLRHEFPGPAELGLRATVLRKMPGYEDGAVIWNPYVALDWRAVGLSIGAISNDPDRGYDSDFVLLPASAHLRLGPRDKFYFSVHLDDDAPIVSGGGAVRAGFGARPARWLDLWMGANVHPYDRAGLLTKADVHVLPALDLNLAGRLGNSEGISENAATVGVTLKHSWKKDR